VGKSNFWEKFDGLGNEIDKIITKAKREVEDSVGNFSYYHSSSSSTIVHGDKKIIIKTENGKTTVHINGKEYVRKDGKV
jgi:hypothetical protein